MGKNNKGKDASYVNRLNKIEVLKLIRESKQISRADIVKRIELRICIEITCPLLRVLLLAYCVENTHHSYGYACVFRLVVKQNNYL